MPQTHGLSPKLTQHFWSYDYMALYKSVDYYYCCCCLLLLILLLKHTNPQAKCTVAVSRQCSNNLYVTEWALSTGWAVMHSMKNYQVLVTTASSNVNIFAVTVAVTISQHILLFFAIFGFCWLILIFLSFHPEMISAHIWNTGIKFTTSLIYHLICLPLLLCAMVFVPDCNSTVVWLPG